MDISQLLGKECSTCTIKTPELNSQQIALYLSPLPAWHVKDGILVREIKLRNFQESLLLANAIGEIAEKQNHHPDLYVRWGSLLISLFTHSINGLSENDFILAAKIEELVSKKIKGSKD